ncbi:hypothetical protein ACHQM5_014124 [Ranunculus cassubicifolius]
MQSGLFRTYTCRDRRRYQQRPTKISHDLGQHDLSNHIPREKQRAPKAGFIRPLERLYSAISSEVGRRWQASPTRNNTIRIFSHIIGKFNDLLLNQATFKSINSILGTMANQKARVIHLTISTSSPQTLYNSLPSWHTRVHCGFMKNGGAEMEAGDKKYVEKCRFVVASGIFDGYDTPHQPSNVSRRSQKLFCFLMVVDDESLNFIEQNVTVRVTRDGGKWVGIWRLILLHNPPYDEPRRNGKVPKIITYRLFPQAQYNIWIDGKMELIVDPLLLLERYLWCGKNTFATARHKHHQSIYEEADAIKRRKRYARPLIDLQMKIYRYEGMQPWSLSKHTLSDVPEGAVIIREHTAINNLFSCLWFNEVNLLTPRDQLSFGYVVYRLGESFKFFMFPNCEYNSIFLLHSHTREHSSKVEWVKSLDEFKKKNNGGLKESRGGLGLWTPYPGDLDSVYLPPVARTSQAG